MSKADEMGLTPEAAEGYEQYFVPAIFTQWPPRLIRLAELKAGDDILDVGCGTGVLTREISQHVVPNGSVTGLDISESMLGVARVKAPEATFYQGNATHLPFENESFDVVFCPFMLMFVPEQSKAIAEMWRVLRPGGRLVISVWTALEGNPVYAELVKIATNRVDAQAGRSLALPFSLGEAETLENLLHAAGVSPVEITTREGRACFPSLEDFVHAEIKAWVLADSVGDSNISVVVDDARTALAGYCHSDGSIDFPMSAVIATAAKF